MPAGVRQERCGCSHSVIALIPRRGGGCRKSNVVYRWCMARTNIDIDEEACRAVMERYDLATKRDAVNLALRRLAGEPLSLDAARALRGSGWEGELDELRLTRVQ